MHKLSDRRRSTPIDTVPADCGTAEEGWISMVGQGPGFRDCPLCRELASGFEANEATEATEAIETLVGVNPESLPMLVRTGWLDDLVELVGRDATVRVMGRAMETEPVEVISMETFLARLGYE